MILLNYALHYLHIVCAAFWLGAMLYTELVLWPRLRVVGQLEPIQAQLRDVKVRKWMAVFIVGTVVTGYLRGLANGAFDRLFTPYGVAFLLGAVIGTGMMVWWASFPPRTMKLGWRLFYSSFWLVMATMVAMRFLA